MASETLALIEQQVICLQEIRLVVGLGNPGARYEGTRHNIGFSVLELLATQNNLGWKTRGRGTEATWASPWGRIILQRPLTFMNESGIAVAEALHWYKLTAENLLVIFDDIALQLGSLRMREKGSAGGHNGIKSLIQHLHTENFWRIKLGIGERKDKRMELTDHVLGKFRPDEMPKVRDLEDRAIDCLQLSIKENPLLAASRFNGPPPEAQPPKPKAAPAATTPEETQR